MIIILRHAEAQKNISSRHGGIGSTLTDLGRTQISTIINDMSDLNIDRIISISRRQCIETSEILSKELRIQFSVENTLQPFNLGVVDGLSEDEVKLHYPNVHEDLKKWRSGNLEISEFEIPGASDPIAFFNEGLRFITRSIDASENTLVVGTRSILVLLYNILLGCSPEIGGGYREVKWGNLEYAIFNNDQSVFSFFRETNGIINHVS